MPTHWETRAEPIPGYRLIERLGRGGFGEVWKAEAPGGLFKAIKFVFGNLTPQSVTESRVNHADQELRALTRVKGVRHPFILSMERFDVIDGQLMIVMELADRNLDDRLRECRKQGLPGIPRTELLKYLTEAAEALDLMNSEHDLQHLDIKPQNLFLVGSHVKVADFGLVKDLEGNAAQVTGGVTPVYAAPETFDGWVSRNSDQYSLAIVFQELLTGRRPFVGPSARQFMLQHLSVDPDLSALPEPDQRVIARALAKDPNQRFPSCGEFIAALEHADGANGHRFDLAARGRVLLDVAGDDGSLSTQLTYRPEPGLSGHKTSVRGVPILRHSSLQVTQDGALCPSLVIGVGQKGVSIVERLRGKLKNRYGDSTSWPPIRLLSIDVDSAVLKTLEKTEPIDREAHDELLICRFRKPSQYFKSWEKLKHLSEWLNPNSLFHITAAGTTSGHRPLGRLALVDNHRRVLARLRGELEQLMSPASIESSMAATGNTLRSVLPRVYVVAAMGGGTGSGMAIDLCYLVRRVLLEAGASQPDVQGVFLAGIGPNAKDRDLRKVNHYALAQNLLDLEQPNTEFIARFEPDAEGDRHLGPPVSRATFIDMSGEHLPEPKVDTALDETAEFIMEDAAGPLGKIMDAPATANADGPFRAMGWFSLIFPRRQLLRRAALRLVKLLAEQWTAPLSNKEGDELTRAAEQSIASAGFDPASISQQMLSLIDQRLPDPLHVLIAQRSAQLEKELQSATESAKHNSLAAAAVDDLKRVMGLDPHEEDSDLDEPPLLDGIVRSTADELCGIYLDPLTKALAQSLDAPGPRLARAKRTLDGFANHFLRLIDRHHDHVRQAQQQVLRRARELYDRVTATLSPGPLFRGSLPQMLERYGLDKMELRLHEQVIQIALLLRARLSDKSRDLVAIRQHLEKVSTQCSEELRKVDIVGGFSSQTLFPGGTLDLEDAVEEACRRLEPLLHELEDRLQVTTLDVMGGLWQASRASDGFETTLCQSLVSAAMTWIHETLPQEDVADAFYQRHERDPAGIESELEAFHEWAAPSMVSRPAKPGEDPLPERFLVSIPESGAGVELVQSLQSILPGRAIEPVAAGDSCTFIRMVSTDQLSRLLPSWLLESRKLYESACQSRTSPEIFPQLAKR